MHVIGTAGHVDHGKSTLVEALTGIDPDRLKEEKEREMTIDLGFAWVSLAEGEEEVGVIDVPGHRDFIENMLAGVGGIDLALMVIAADEGVMPQTREHLAVVDLLGIHSGVIALTKADLISDPDWLDLVMLDVAEATHGTVLENAPLVPVSAVTGQGLDDLRAALLEGLAGTPPRLDSGRPRLPIDRVFSISGFGTIVTGTLLGGHFSVGDAVEVQPAGLQGRIRGLQTHKRKLDKALPGSRVAVNLSGISKDELRRGQVVTAPGLQPGTVLCDVSYRHLPGAREPLGHNTSVKLFVGAAEVMVRTRVLGVRQIEPGNVGWLQLALAEPVSVARGDRFILRRPSPPATIGGGEILDPYPGRRHRRFRPEILERLSVLAQGDPDDLLLHVISRHEPVSKADLAGQTSHGGKDLEESLVRLIERGIVVAFGDVIMSVAGRDRAVESMVRTVQDFHQRYPLRQGMPREELRSRLGHPPTVFSALLAYADRTGAVEDAGAILRLPEHEVQLSPEQEAQVDRLMAAFDRAGVNSPSVRDARAAVGEQVYQALLEQGRIIQLNADVVYAAGQYQRIRELVLGYLEQNQQINASQLRDLLDTSRKYAIGMLEHLDDAKVTRRVGDNRVLAQQKQISGEI